MVYKLVRIYKSVMLCKILKKKCFSYIFGANNNNKNDSLKAILIKKKKLFRKTKF